MVTEIDPNEIGTDLDKAFKNLSGSEIQSLEKEVAEVNLAPVRTAIKGIFADQEGRMNYQYLDYAPLTPAEEKTCGFDIMAAKKVVSNPLASDLAKKEALAICQDRRNKLLSSVSGLISWQAIKYFYIFINHAPYHGGMTLGDLEQSTTLGALVAADRFNPNKGKYSVYSLTYMQKFLQDAVSKGIYPSVLPHHAHIEITKLRRALPELTQGQGPDLTNKEIGQRINVTPQQAAYLRRVSTVPDHLSRPSFRGKMSFGEVDPLEQTLPNPGASTYDQAEQLLLRNALQAVMEFWGEDEQKVATLHFGLEISLAEIGRMMGVTRERTRQIKDKALDKVRNPKDYFPHNQEAQEAAANLHHWLDESLD